MADYYDLIEKGTSLVLLAGIIIIGKQYLKLQDLYVAQSQKSIEFIVKTITVLDTIKNTQNVLNSSTSEGYNKLKDNIDDQSKMFISVFEKLEKSLDREAEARDYINRKVGELDLKIVELSNTVSKHRT